MNGDLRGQTCVLTGATSGIGRAAAVELARREADLVLVGRNEAAGLAAARDLQRHAAGRIEFVRVDLSRPDQVRTLAARACSRSGKVDVLINNAGARIDRFCQNPSGIELTFATNHIGHFLLTFLLADALVAAPSGRVITVASGNHFAAAADDVWNMDEANFDRRMAYAKSKLANVMFAYELARRLASTRVTSNAVDPGIAASNFGRNNGTIAWLRHLGYHALHGQLVSPRKGAETLVYLATSVAVRGITGKYFRDRQEVPSSPASYDLVAARSLWDLSLELTGLHSAPAAGAHGLLR